MDLTFSINNQTLTRTDSIGIIGETVGQFTASFTFNSWWNDYDKTVQFSKLGKVYEILLTDGSCVVPWEVLTGGVFYVTVYATQGAQKIKTTNEVAVSVTSSGLNKDGFYSPTPEMYAQLISEINKKLEKAVFTGNIEDVAPGVYMITDSDIKASEDVIGPVPSDDGYYLNDGLLSVTRMPVYPPAFQWVFIGKCTWQRDGHSNATLNNIFYGLASEAGGRTIESLITR